MTELKIVEIFSDGACSGNPGPGGWGTVLKYLDHEREICGGETLTTNNRMELKAVIEGISFLKERCKLKIYTDSQYVANGINKGWAIGWKNNGWKKSDKKPALNSDLWNELLEALSQHEYEIVWIRGHAGHPENERCDMLAVEQAKKFSSLC
ncbi:MAG: ribonuclease HI [Eubacteriales bacterium]